MKSTTKTLLKVLILVFAASAGATSQNLLDRKAQKTVVPPECADIFRVVERGFAEGSITPFSNNLAPQFYLNLPGSDGGYYSANQGYYILQNFLGSRNPQSFRFTTYGQLETTPYATGPGRFTTKSGVETVQVYVALSRLGNRWVISQINVY